ncbi:hypothetical protein OMP38_19720 [Cohnella ginsengisoli]|uniref:Uncharacterized protein n=1 Tax=Cohnella ginsengisoli TaxID=425004 RepID=A0A9X4KK32_9BACL|nr:hypothetical protein [Cohnella ginsengisoli]MDG0792849.1 hypothetical protein [Cohnella ginsengisoli]
MLQLIVLRRAGRQHRCPEDVGRPEQAIARERFVRCGQRAIQAAHRGFVKVRHGQMREIAEVRIRPKRGVALGLGRMAHEEQQRVQLEQPLRDGRERRLDLVKEAERLLHVLRVAHLAGDRRQAPAEQIQPLRDAHLGNADRVSREPLDLGVLLPPGGDGTRARRKRLGVGQRRDGIAVVAGPCHEHRCHVLARATDRTVAFAVLQGFEVDPRPIGRRARHLGLQMPHVLGIG